MANRGEWMGIAAPGAGETTRLPVILLDANGAVVTGEAWNAAGMTVAYRKDGATSWTAFPSFATTNWDEIGYGLYDVILDGDEADEAALLDTPGFWWLYVKTDNTRGDVFVYNTDDRTLTAWLGGAKVCTFTAQDGDGNPVGSCPFLLKHSGGQVLLDCTTNSGTGQVVVNLDEADNYAVTLGTLAGYTFANPYDVDVGVAATQAFTLTCTKLSEPSAPADPTLCRVYAYMKEIETGQNLGAGDGSLNAIAVVTRPAGSTVVYGDGVAARETDADGYVYVDIVRGAVVTLKATWTGTPSVGREKIIEQLTVPDTATYDVGADLQA